MKVLLLSVSCALSLFATAPYERSVQRVAIRPHQSCYQANSSDTPATRFRTSDPELQHLYDQAALKCLGNIQTFGQYEVLVEGAGYPNVWLETQPMGGEMYAKRNIAIARDNQLIFMDQQRADGRMPGMISLKNGQLSSHYGWLQGFCFARPALNMYYWLGQDRAYLEKLYHCLKGFDAYLWKNRDSDGDGCLESWCVWDTGEDNSIRLDGAPEEWNQETAPNDSLVRASGIYRQAAKTTPKLPVPLESMDVMSYSYSCRAVLARISAILKNGEQKQWQNAALKIQQKIRSYLWDPEKSACYDRDPQNRPVAILLHNNIRCMYYGSFDQSMADAFIAKHFFNPKEFWTPMPLPSIAANDPAFRNIPNNNWSGQSQGLSFQRAISALENYGHYAEVPLIGYRLLAALLQNHRFTQQYDPFTRQADKTGDGYGPTLLSMLEYISRMYGIHYENDQVIWSCLNSDRDTTEYEQLIHHQRYKLRITPKGMEAFLNGKLLFQGSPCIRIVTDVRGKLLEIIGLDQHTNKVKLNYRGRSAPLQLRIHPNEVYRYSNNQLSILRRPFTPPPAVEHSDQVERAGGG